MSALQLRAAALTDVGRARERNEDSVFAGKHIFAVADGLGGHRAGEVASKLAIDSISLLDQSDEKSAAHRLGEAVRKGNAAVYERAQRDSELKGMGTTITAVAVSGDTAHLAHVGDSRCYLVRASQISQLSSDHTLVARMVSEGRLTPEQAEAHPQRSVLTRALGADRHVEVDEARITLVPGDRLVLCSDGLTGVLTDEEIAGVVGDGADLDEICHTLIDEANARGGPDNITAVVVDVSSPVGSTYAPPREPEERERGRRRLVRPLVWLALLLTLALGGLAGVRAWADRSYFLGVSGDHVAIYRGLPVQFAGIHLSKVVEDHPSLKKTDIASWVLPRLEDGIRVSSLAEARQRLAELPRATKSPAPKPSGSPSPHPSPRKST